MSCDIITAAIIRAAEEVADVISMSFAGGADGWSDSVIAVAASRATERGVVVTVSAGKNDVQVRIGKAAGYTLTSRETAVITASEASLNV